jgi:thioredoxin
MKRTSFLIISILIITAFSCSSKSADEKNESEPKIENKYDNQGKVIQMNKSMFIDLVMDYENNKQNWNFKGQKPCIIDFYADWCRPCKIVAPIMEELAKEYEGKLNIYKVNVDQEKELAGVFQVQSIPSILFCPKEGNPAIQPGALSKEQYKQIIDEFLMKSVKNENDSIKK